MKRLALLAVLAAMTTWAPAEAQVEVTPLAAPDLFSVGYGDTGLGADVWRGASPAFASSVIPRLAQRPLTPAAAALAIRILSSGGAAPEGAGADADLAAARADALIALGLPQAAAVILNRAPTLDHSPALSHSAAEAFLRTGQDARACEVAHDLQNGRDEVYWLRLRAYCQALAGDADAAGLTFSLANQAAHDPVYSRLMSVVIAGSGAPGAPSYRNGIEIALSRHLGLPAARDAAIPDVATPEVIAELAPLVTAAGGGDRAPFDALFEALSSGATPVARGRLQGRILLLTALGQPLTDAQRAQAATFEAGPGAAPAGALLALSEAAAAGQKGQTALAVLAICGAAAAHGPALADRITIVAALHRAGLAADAQAFAVEGLAALRGP